MELKRGRRWLNSWLPSRRLGMDPLQDLRIDERYAPVSIANWKLVPSVAGSLLARRVMRPLMFSAHRRLTIVIPYRDRRQHLLEMLPALSAQLRAQQVRHRIVVVEQSPGGLFNRGKLINVGVHFTADDTDYYCLHDVDALPQTANYLCPSQPLRLVNQVIGAQGRKRHNDYYFSGAVSLRKEQFFAVNGFSNDYWGWGKEDDDFFFRLLLAGYLCYYDLQGAFHDLPNPRHQQVRRGGLIAPAHVRRNRRHRSRLLRGLTDPAEDGLSTLRYEVAAHTVESVEGAAYEKICVRW
jgi:hypothetical protein